MVEDPHRYFRPEAREIVERLSQGVLDLENGASPASVAPGLLRLAHTLKGAARVVKQIEIAELAHSIETVLAPLRERSEALGRSTIDEILQTLDVIATRVASLSPGPKPEEGHPGTPPDDALRTIRTDIEELDAVLDSLSEIHVRFGAVRRTFTSVENARHLAELLVEQAASPRMRSGPAGSLTAVAEELRTSLVTIERGASSGIESVERELRQVRNAAEQLRLIPASTLFPSLQRTARDVAGQQGRTVLFEARGGDVRLDAHVLGTLQPALVQLVRNAAGHGVESAAERLARGKPAEGRVVIDVSRRGKRAVFRCEDDGRGIDLAAVRRAAEQKGVITGSAESPGAEGLLELLLKGGLTTLGAATQVSGRGVGLDLVREATSRLGGDLSARTEPGRGTVVEIVVPVSVSSLEALLVEADGLTAAVALEATRGAVRVAPADVALGPGGTSIVFEGHAIPLAELSRIMGRHVAAQPGPRSAIVVEGSSGRAAISVQKLLGTKSLVVRPLPPNAPASPIVIGAALDSEGTPLLVLDADELVLAARGDRLDTATESPSPVRLLIVDDSLTTRMLEQSILESAGYEAHVAASGDEALAMARQRDYALFLVDIEMPGMDGFTFVETSRSDPRLRDIPSILVTSRTSPDDRRRGDEVGALAFVVKSEFDQNELLRIIRGLVRQR